MCTSAHDKKPTLFGHYSHSERSEESRSCSGASFWRHLMAPAGGALPLRSCRAVGRVSRTGVTRHRSPSSDYATLIRPTTLEEAVKIALTLPSPRGRGTKECAILSRHLMAPAGGAAPQSRTLFGGEDCLSEASSAALARISHQPPATGAGPLAVPGRTPASPFDIVFNYAFSVSQSVRPSTTASRRPRDGAW